MIRRLIILLLIVGCSTEPEVQWVCKIKPEGLGYWSVTDTTTIYSSYEGCDSLCVSDLSGQEYVGPGENPLDWAHYCKEIN